jgi:hypothetical protein
LNESKVISNESKRLVNESKGTSNESKNALNGSKGISNEVNAFTLLQFVRDKAKEEELL